MTKIIFICHGNICRSPMAEFIFKDYLKKAGLEDRFEIDSAATSREEIGNGIYRPAQRIMAEKGIPFESHAARQITVDDAEHFDYIIAMEKYNVINAVRLLGEKYRSKMSLLLDYDGGGDVSDPWYSDDFETAYQDIARGCRALLEKLK